MQIKRIENARYLENGAIDCEVLFEGMDEPLPYTATPDDTAATGRQIWQALQSGEYPVIPFTVTPELLAAAREAKKQEINAWRAEQEARPFMFEWNGHTWNAGPDSLVRIYPAAMAAKGQSARSTMTWGDADNQQVKLSMQKLEELATAMVQAQLMRNDEIYHRQRAMKDALDSLNDLPAVRAFRVGE